MVQSHDTIADQFDSPGNQIDSLRNRTPNILGHESCFKSAVFLPLVYKDMEWQVLFERRAKNLKIQPGEICFPGGAIEPKDRGPQDAAVRETCEELGLKREDIEVIAPLDIMVSPFNALIYPYLGYIYDEKKIKASKDEVEEIFFVPLSFLLDHKPIYRNVALRVVLPEDYPYELIPHGRNYPYRDGRFPQHFFIWEDKVIWGLTARILNHFLNLIR